MEYDELILDGLKWQKLDRVVRDCTPEEINGMYWECIYSSDNEAMLQMRLDKLKIDMRKLLDR